MTIHEPEGLAIVILVGIVTAIYTGLTIFHWWEVETGKKNVYMPNKRIIEILSVWLSTQKHRLALKRLLPILNHHQKQEKLKHE